MYVAPPLPPHDVSCHVTPVSIMYTTISHVSVCFSIMWCYFVNNCESYDSSWYNNKHRWFIRRCLFVWDVGIEDPPHRLLDRPTITGRRKLCPTHRLTHRKVHYRVCIPIQEYLVHHEIPATDPVWPCAWGLWLFSSSACFKSKKTRSVDIAFCGDDISWSQLWAKST